MKFAKTTAQEFPNPEALMGLISQYAGSQSESAAQSSHWKHFAAETQLTTSADGLISRIQGIGFGDYNESPLLWPFGILNFVTYFPFLKIPMPAFFKSLRLLIQLKAPMFSYDGFRHACLMAQLTPYLRRLALANPTSKPVVCLIGDGWGLLSALIKKSFPEVRIVIVDLGKVLSFSCMFLQDRFPLGTFTVLDESATKLPESDFTFIPAEKIRNLFSITDSLDFAINVASMQEMDHHWIEFYFQWLRRGLKSGALFYCCNRESKTLPDGSMAVFSQYPWKSADRILLDEEPSFYRWFFAPGKTERNVSIVGVKIPFMHKFDGDNRHRIVELSRLLE